MEPRIWNSPISLLKPGLQGVINQITSGLPLAVQTAIVANRISFMYDDRPLPLHTPEADLSNNQIILRDVHLAFIWCCSYATVALNNMYYDEAPSGKDIIKFDHRIEMPKVNLTLTWGRSLVETVSYWPEGAARPDVADQWTQSATNLFQACMAYVVFHEIAHLILHSDLKSLMATRHSDPFYETSLVDQKRIYDGEQEADEFALDALIGSSALNEVRLIKYLGAALAHLSNFYLLDVPDTRCGPTHPDLDDRLIAVLKKAKLRQEADQIQLQAHISVGLQLFLTLTGKAFIPEDPEGAVFADFEALQQYLLGLITQMKEAARARQKS